MKGLNVVSKYVPVVIVCVVMLRWCGTADAAPIQWTTGPGANSHWYEVVDAGGINWSDAKSAAETMQHAGSNGFLATITSAEENGFVTDLLNSVPDGVLDYHWIGGFQDPNCSDYSEPAGGWRWIEAPDILIGDECWGTNGYRNWAVGQPDNANGGTEHHLLMFGGSASSPPERRGGWNDYPGSRTDVRWYVAEFVPEPATFSLLAFGLMIVARRRRQA